MTTRTKLIVVVMLALSLILTLTACMGQWFTPKQVATLIIGKPVISGNRGEVVISVANMPGQGLASIAIDEKGITFNDINAATITATGLNGFTVLAQDFTTTPGKGCLVAANSTSGNVSGPILKITFEVTGANPTLEIVDQGKVTLGSALNTLIPAWTLSSNATDYYVR